MSAFMLVQTCRGTCSTVELDSLRVAVSLAVSQLSKEKLQEWEEYFGDGVLMSALDHWATLTVFADNEDFDWDNPDCERTFRSKLFLELLESAKQVYLEERMDITYVDLGGKRWFVSGGMSYGDDPTDACRLLHQLSWSGVDEVMARLATESTPP